MISTSFAELDLPRPSRRFAIRLCTTVDWPGCKKPIRHFDFCCAPNVNGHTTAPPTRPIKVRRFNSSASLSPNGVPLILAVQQPTIYQIERCAVSALGQKAEVAQPERHVGCALNNGHAATASDCDNLGGAQKPSDFAEVASFQTLAEQRFEHEKSRSP